MVYEGYGAGGAAIMVQAMTDNRNRTVADIRSTFGKNGGNLGESGCVDWIFEQKAVFEVSLDGHDPEELTLEVIDAGAEDVEEFGDGDETLILYADPEQFNQMREALEAKKLTMVRAETQLVPKTKIDLPEKESLQTLRLIDKLEDLDDVQNVYTNAMIADEYAEKYTG